MKSIDWSPATGEDAGKVFVIKRMNAFAADKWAMRTVKALMRGGVQIPASAMDGGILGLSGVAIHLFAHMDDTACEQAFQSLLDCVKIQKPGKVPAPVLDTDIEDPQTLTDLRTEAFKLHTGFFKAAASQISPLAAALTPDQPPASSHDTPT